MRLPIFLASLVAAGALVSAATAASPKAGELSVERGRGAVVLEIRGSVLGRLGSGTLRVTDTTPRDPYAPLVTGRKVTEERLGLRTVLYRGVGLRFRMVGGSYRIAARGNGISLSAVGRGFVTLDGEPRLLADDAGIYSINGADCSLEPFACLPLPIEPERFAIEPPAEQARGAR
jgi:hypothetical protein